MITYRATLDVPRELAWFVRRQLAAERRRRGTPHGTRDRLDAGDVRRSAHWCTRRRLVTARRASERRDQLTILGSGHGRLHEVHGGVAISMRALADVEVDAGKRSARIGAGATWEPVLGK